MKQSVKRIVIGSTELSSFHTIVDVPDGVDDIDEWIKTEEWREQFDPNTDWQYAIERAVVGWYEPLRSPEGEA